MTSRLVAITHDTLDPQRLTQFWSSLLDIDTISFRIEFIATSEPKTSRNRIHFDLPTASQEHQNTLVARAVELGATHADVGQGPHEPHVVLADPEGNEFCVIEPGNQFLADTGPIGAVNCDGTEALGHFWSTALDWPLVWDQNQETAIQSPHGGPKITWSGPPLMPRHGRDRLRLVVSPVSSDIPAETQRLVHLGATLVSLDGDHRAILTDPDGNEFTLIPCGDASDQAVPSHLRLR